jgi:hypothetical protein
MRCKKRLAILPNPAGMSLTKLSLAGNNLIIPGQRESLVSDIPAGDWKIANIFLPCGKFGIDSLHSFESQFLNEMKCSQTITDLRIS